MRIKQFKRNRDPRQLSFNFDVMVDHIEHLQIENIDDNKPVINTALAPPHDSFLAADISNISHGTLSSLLLSEGYTIKNYDNLDIVHNAWISSQSTSPDFDNWTFSWNYFKRTGLFKSIASSVATKELAANTQNAQSLSSEYIPLGLNKGQETVFELHDGSRMASRDLRIMRTVDGDTDIPQALYDRGKHQYLTVEEVSAFARAAKLSARNQPLPLEVYNDRRADSATGNSQDNPQAGNDSRNHITEVQQSSLPDFGQVGTQQSGYAEGIGSKRMVFRNDTLGPAGDVGASDVDQRHSLGDGPSGDERLGDFRNIRRRYGIENFRITPGDRLGFGGAKAKYADNIAAIHLLQELQQQRAVQASPEEKKILVRYVGWGGLPQVFDSGNDKWASEYHELKSLLPEDDYAKARRSTQDAHYTSETVVRGIYHGLARMGLADGNPLVLEPSAGIGNFIGLSPENLSPHFVAVELDPTSSSIAQYLYPKTRFINIGFQNSGLSKVCFDAVIGNPPFGSQSLYDPDFPELRSFSIHNYFLAKSISLLREGGVAAFVVSRFFLDAVDPTVREHIAQSADFLGAVRLPETAFKQNALTEVTTDIVFFQKNSGEKLRNRDWVHTSEIEVDDLNEGGRRTVAVNNFYSQHPEQIIGKMVLSGGMYRDSLNCVADPSLDLGTEIEKRLAVLPLIYVPRSEVEKERDDVAYNEEFISSDYFGSLKLGALCVEPQSLRIVFKTHGLFGESVYAFAPVKSDVARQRVSAMVHIRDTLRLLINAEKSNVDELEIEAARRQLNTLYDVFARRYGHLNSQTNRSLFRSDPEHSLLESLEVDYDKGLSPDAARRQGRPARPASAKKAAIFRQRVLLPAQTVDHATSSQDALVIALRETGKVDFTRMEQLLGRPVEDIQKELQHAGLIFLNPTDMEWEIRDKYLAGNVRDKLRAANTALQTDSAFASNVEALSKVMPPDVEAVDIGIRFGSPWVPGEVFTAFIDECISNTGYRIINYVQILGRWDARISIHDDSADCDVWGIPECSASNILVALLANRPIKVEKDSGHVDKNGKPIMVVDQELTVAALQKADTIRQAFLDWIWTDDDRRIKLSKLYNERFNTHVPPRYDGSHVVLTGASSAVALRPHQKDVVWRSIQEGGALFDHVMGAGKTLACIATVMESRRMGFMRKPMLVVPNHLLYQWRDEFFRLYPAASILVAEKTDFIKQNRERFFSRVATGDWDAVIVAHSSFRKIDMPGDTQELILKEQIDAVVSAISDTMNARGARSTIKLLEKQRDKMKARYQNLLGGIGPRDRSVDFADLGVDALFIDESQEFKNLGYTTSMNVSGLGDVTGSAKALDLFIKCRYLQQKNSGRGVYFMTGTPISNTIAEVYTLQRYLQLDELRSKGIEYFDAWASTFGQVTSGWELDATGVNYKLKSRFASFQNVPELLSMYRSFADVVTKNDLDDQARKAGLRPLTPPVTGGKPYNDIVDRSEAQASYMDEIIYRMEHLPADPRLDNPLVITNDARKAGLDYRLIEPDADDYPWSKVNAAVERIYSIWADNAADLGTQLVFCDLSTPKGRYSPNKKMQEPVIEFADQETGGIFYGTDCVEPIGEMPDTEGDDDGEDTTVARFMDDVVSATSRFSVYDDMKSKLVDKGIPADEIAYIHDANTDIRKAKLFSDMNAGRIRILMGSTSKMGAGMNVQERLVAAHHLDAPWRPSDLQQRNGRIIRQGNVFYERDPDNFSVSIYYYATKRTYDARMWQTIEYKAAAIEQFRKGDLLQRVIDDVQSEASNAAEMKAAASGNPLILMQVQFASDLRKLEALYSQHQRSQHRLQDRLNWLASSQDRKEAADAIYFSNVKLRDEHTTTLTEKDKVRIAADFTIDGRIFHEQDAATIMDALQDGVKSVTRFLYQKSIICSYRGFEVTMLRSFRASEADGFRFALKGTGEQEFQPDNLTYSFDEKFSLPGFFQRLNNFLDKGLQQAHETFIANIEREKAELETVKAALGQEFPQKDELSLVRKNHAAIVHELQRMQNEPTYVSLWVPLKSLSDDSTSEQVFQQDTLLKLSNDGMETEGCQPVGINDTQYEVYNFLTVKDSSITPQELQPITITTTSLDILQRATLRSAFSVRRRQRM